MIKLHNTLVLFIFTLLLTVACGATPSPEAQTEPAPSAETEVESTDGNTANNEGELVVDPNSTPGSYPPPVVVNDDLPYPPPTPAPSGDSYPLPTVEPKDESKRFTIARPLAVGDTVVSGTGPAGIGITVVNLADISVPLGTGSIDGNGEFSINIAPALEGNTVVALMVGAGVSEDDFRDAPGITDIPFIGLVLDRTTVE